jgi:hypothetical protein
VTIEEDRERYIAACHAMQTGVAYQMQVTNECDPKHIRVGVNSAMVNDRAMTELLIEKGIITEEEYFAKIAVCMELEVADYQERVKKQFGGNVNITLA